MFLNVLLSPLNINNENNVHPIFRTPLQYISGEDDIEKYKWQQ
jgi:hypothetical protein